MHKRHLLGLYQVLHLFPPKSNCSWSLHFVHWVVLLSGTLTHSNRLEDLPMCVLGTTQRYYLLCQICIVILPEVYCVCIQEADTC